jgi:hypothetical protein
MPAGFLMRPLRNGGTLGGRRRREVAMSRIIQENSPLARIPRGLYPPMKGWIEGIRYSVDIADVAMHRLCSELDELTRLAKSGGSGPVDPELQACAVADAWTFVDAVWRLKRFLVDSNPPRAPGPPQQLAKSGAEYTADIRGFRAALKPLKTLRDGYQHLDNQAPKLAENGETVWGHLNWIAFHSSSKNIQTCLLVTGDNGKGESTFDVVNPVGLAIRGPIDHIRLFAFGSSADLSELYHHLIAAVRELERVLGHQLPDQPQVVGGFLAILDLEPQSD